MNDRTIGFPARAAALALGLSAVSACTTEPVEPVEPVEPASLLGEWKRYADDGGLASRYVFGAEGSYVYEEWAGDEVKLHVIGTYQDDGDGLYATGIDQVTGLEHTRLATYHVDADGFLPGAGVPDEAPAGIVGTWDRYIDVVVYPADGPGTVLESFDVTLYVRDDGSVRRLDRQRVYDQDLEGTYDEVAPGLYDFVFPLIEGTGELVERLRLVEGQALVTGTPYVH